MIEETKKKLMQIVYKLAEHYEIPNATLVSFKKRNLILELLNKKNSIAHKLIHDLIESVIIADRIQNDKEKQEKKPDHWAIENTNGEEKKKKAAEKLIQFFKKEGISKEGLNFEI